MYQVLVCVASSITRCRRLLVCQGRRISKSNKYHASAKMQIDHTLGAPSSFSSYEAWRARRAALDAVIPHSGEFFEA